jgi:hypothetical protein
MRVIPSAARDPTAKPFVLSEAKDLLRDRERSFVAPLLRTADYRRLDDGACRA